MTCSNKPVSGSLYRCAALASAWSDVPTVGSWHTAWVPDLIEPLRLLSRWIVRGMYAVPWSMLPKQIAQQPRPEVCRMLLSASLR